MRGAAPPFPEGAQVNQEEWVRFYDQFGHARVRRVVKFVSRLPSAPRCEACGNPFRGPGGALMRLVGKGPSRKNPRWCRMCFEMAPDGGATLTIGVLFADIRGSTAFGETTSPTAIAEIMNRFYSDVTKVIVRHDIVDKLIGDEVMGLYFPPLAPEGRYVDAMVSDARELLQQSATAPRKGPVSRSESASTSGPRSSVSSEGAMTEQHDRDELVELMSRYANMPDTQNWDELPRSVFCDEFTCDFSSLGPPVTTFSRDAWCQRTKQVFAGWTATHHAITNHRIAIDGDRATIRAHIRAEHWAPPDVAAGGPNCWLVVGFYDDVAVRTPEGWRLSSVKLTLTHQENEALLAASMAAVKD